MMIRFYGVIYLPLLTLIIDDTTFAEETSSCGSFTNKKQCRKNRDGKCTWVKDDTEEGGDGGVCIEFVNPDPPQCKSSPVELIPYRPYLDATFTLPVDDETDDDVLLKTFVFGNYNDARAISDTFASFYWINKTAGGDEFVFIGNNYGLPSGDFTPVRPCTTRPDPEFFEESFLIDKETYNTWAVDTEVSIYANFSNLANGNPAVNDVCESGNKVYVQLDERSSQELFAPTSKRLIFDFPHRAYARSEDTIMVNTYVKGGYTSDDQFATFYLVDEDYDVQDVNMSNVYELGTSSGGEIECEYYEQSFVVSSKVYNEYTSNPGRNLRVLMVQSASVFDGGKCAGGSGPPLFQPNFGQAAYVNITDRLCKTPEGNGIMFQNNDIGHMGIEVVAEPTSEAAFVKGSMSLVIMLLVLVSW